MNPCPPQGFQCSFLQPCECKLFAPVKIQCPPLAQSIGNATWTKTGFIEGGLQFVFKWIYPLQKKNKIYTFIVISWKPMVQKCILLQCSHRQKHMRINVLIMKHCLLMIIVIVLDIQYSGWALSVVSVCALTELTAL